MPLRSPRHLLAPYRRLFAVPGARAFTAGNLVARLPMGMFSVSAVIMIAERYGSYALAGAVPAAGLAATAVVGPLTARLVDRRGQARIAVPAAAIAALGSLVLALCVHLRAPAWTLFAAYVLTATTPNTGGMSRARWAHAFRGPGPGNAAALHTANSFEQAADELCFMTGPVLAALLCTTAFPEAGTVTGAVLLMGGILLFASQRATEPPPRPRAPGERSRSPLRRPGFPPLLAVFCCAGAVFGSMEVVTIAYADRLGRPAAAGGILALLAAGSCLAGLVYGARRPAHADSPAGPGGSDVTEVSVAETPVTETSEAADTSAPESLFLRCVLAMAALMLLPLLAAATGRLALLAPALLLAGMATAPTMITGMSLVQARTPAGRLNEGMTLAVTALLAGIAAGSATGGWAAGGPAAGAPAAAYAVPLAAATAAALAATALAPAGLKAARRPAA
ncbi:MFS transporter [Streptomyces sp. WAC 06738]|uniref:MFS transporter n=1 Tax=Streptomyces sp. WAC 06738 TaxID=2203210 RepID=UPI000F6CF305|nr:MFS transporter [Streptomyces sp. WAC 06738]AZM46300.1 MFS transporter [Streptomyces sp. WAC 06738]